MPKLVRYRGGVILRHPETGAPFVPNDDLLEASDPLVKAYPWAFASDEELAEEQANARQIDSVEVEAATRRPGQKRRTRKS